MERATLTALILVLCSHALWAAEAPTECDVLASNPEDPDRRAPPVAREKMDLPKAIAVCESQVKRDPKDLRALYQLARSLIYAGETTRGVPLMKQAADAGDRQAQFVYGLLIDRARPDAPLDICIAEAYWLKSARQGRQAARVTYVHHALRGQFDGCKVEASAAEMKDFVAAAKKESENYYEGVLIDDLAQSLAEPDCHSGAYTLADKMYVDVVPSGPGKLRWRMLDGRSGLLSPSAGRTWTSTLGWTDRADGITVRFGSCDARRIAFGDREGRKESFDVVETTFQGKGEMLRGRLVLPSGTARVTVAVMVHGGEDYSGVDRYHHQHLFPAHGVGIFVYDKRGTGGSTGRYTQDFHVLAADAAAALEEARRLAGRRASSVGFFGGSQGGWVAPLAATNGRADFVAVAFGLAEGPLAEDREQVMLDLRAAGYGPEALAKAREVTDATGMIMASRFKRGFDELDAARAKYAQEPWWPAMRGEFTGELAAYTGAALSAMGTTGGSGTTWGYEPMPVLRKLEVPQLWILAAEDREAPAEETRRRLQALARDGKPITLAVFPRTDHGMVEFETDANGNRTATRYTDGYFRMLIDWLSTRALGNAPYGSAEILARP